MCAYNSINEFPACTNKMLLKEHLRDAWGFKGFVVSDCGAIVDVNQGHKKAPDIMHWAALSLRREPTSPAACGRPDSTPWRTLSSRAWSPRTEVTQAAERLYTARFKLGLFDPQGSNPLDKIPFSDIASDANRQISLHAAEETIVLLKNNGILHSRARQATSP